MNVITPMFEDLLAALRRHPDPLLSDRLQELIGFAAIDRDLAARLLADPRKIAAEWGLKGHDLRAASSATGAADVAEFAVKLEQAFAGTNHSGRVAVKRLAKRRKRSARKAS